MLVLVVVNGFTGGLVSNVQKNFADLIAGHIYFIQLEKGADGRLLNMVTDDKALMEALKTLKFGYTAATRRTAVMGTVIFGGESVGRQITGINWKEDTQMAGNLKFLAGDAKAMDGSDGIVISSLLAESLGLIPKKTLSYKDKALLKQELRAKWKEGGKKFNLDKTLDDEVKKKEAALKIIQIQKAPLAIGEEVLVELKTIYGQQNVGDFRVRGIYDARMDIAAYVDREKLNALVAMPAGSYNLFGLFLKDYSNLNAKTMELYTALKGKYDLVPMAKVTGRSSNTIVSDLAKDDFKGTKTLITNLDNELGSIIGVLTGVQAGSFVLFLIVLAVVMVGLVNTFRIVIYERTKEIGTTRAVGMQRGQIRRLFLLEALFLSLGGTIPGGLLGVGILNIVKLFEFSSFTEMGLFLDNGRITWALSPALFVGSFLTVILFTLLAALLPANRAAKMEPAHALRTQF
jgi:putative ABC transport system permease protein